MNTYAKLDRDEITTLVSVLRKSKSPKAKELGCKLSDATDDQRIDTFELIGPDEEELGGSDED